MKKSYLFLTTLLVVAAISVAVVSCKKETQSNLMNNQTESLQAFNPLEIEDMNAYLKDFKQKMQSAVKGEDEALSLEDAAWHLSSLANYEFANANKNFDNILFDSLTSTTTVINGSVLLSDLSKTYESICVDIDKFYHSLMHENKHFRFIGANISESGVVTISLFVTYCSMPRYMEDTLWHFPNLDYADSICDVYFFDNINYKWNNLGATELQRALNCYESHNWYSVDPNIVDGREYYVYTRHNDFNFHPQHYNDPFGSPNIWDSRLFAVPGNPEYNIPKIDMCYYYDSYLGMEYQYIVEHPYGNNEHPVQWEVIPDEQVFYPSYYCTYYHNLKVTYGRCNMAQNQNYY